MIQQQSIHQPAEAEAEHPAEAHDPDVPAGNAPPGPKWPLVLSGLAWLAWVVFLFVMVLSTRAQSAA